MVGGLIPIYEMPSFTHVTNCAKLLPDACGIKSINAIISSFLPFACVLFVLVGGWLEEMNGVCKVQGPCAQ